MLRLSRSRRPALTLVEQLVVLAILAVLAGLLLPAVQKVRAAGQRARCANNLRQIGLALHNYHGTRNLFPPGISYQNGADPYPFMSWNTRLLPYLEQSAVWAQAEAAYRQTRNFLDDPPHPLSTPMPVFGCPTDPRTLVGGKMRTGSPIAFTIYLGVEGTNQFRRDGVLFLDSRVRFADIVDGTSQTLAAGERPPRADGVFGWWYAGWGQNQEGSAEMVLGALERNHSDEARGCPVGPYRFGPGRIDNPCDIFHFWSLHPGGAHFLLADGSARYLSYSAEPLMPALATRARGEPVSLPD